jgi:hypothetical protein
MSREYRSTVHKKQYGFTKDPDRYRTFLASHLLELEPKFFGVKGKRKIDTPDGTMFIVHLIEETADPNLDIIAECFINNEDVYLWNDRCWTKAVDKNGKPITRNCRPTEVGIKVMILYEIGSAE